MDSDLTDTSSMDDSSEISVGGVERRVEGCNVFERLPVEIMDLVVKQLMVAEEVGVAGDLRARFHSCKSLRAVSRTVANLPRLNRELFWEMHFYGVPGQLKLLATLDMSRMAPYVKYVAFVPYPFSSSTSFEEFDEFYCRPEQDIEYYPVQNDLHNDDDAEYEADDDEYYDEEDGDYDVADEYIVGNSDKFYANGFPTSSPENNYVDFINSCIEAERCLESRLLREVWTNVLSSFKNLEAIELTSVKKMAIDLTRYNMFAYSPFLPNLNQKTLWRHIEESREQRNYTLQNNRLLSNVIHCLAETGLRCRSIQVESSMLNRVDWKNLPGLDKVDLNSLSELMISSSVNLCDVGRCSVASSPNYVHSIFRMKRHALKSIQLSPFVSGYVWLSSKVGPLPDLVDFEITGVRINGKDFAQFLTGLKCLKSLTLVRVTVDCDYTHYEWKHVFHALRTHPNAIHIVFYDIDIIASEWLADFYSDPTGIMDPYLIWDTDFSDGVSDPMEAVELYIRNRIPWTHCLEGFLTCQF